ncbi:coatomer subunit gamma-2-like [Artemia franciscana]|uniref:coatomer subunit gamma-2-like n=1 Tax=Artemia franciscana TaxID=6661 RepID=UPI0032DAA06B
MFSSKRDKKDEEDLEGGNPFGNLDKSTFLLEASSLFNETSLNTRKCTFCLGKILVLLNQGESMSRAEATKAFFAITKLSQSRDVNLRRMMYLAIKELSQKADDVIMATQTLIKDVTGKDDNCKAPALRALLAVIDTSMIQSIERYIRESLVSRSLPALSSAALVSSMHLLKACPDIVGRWASDIQQVALSSDNQMVQYQCVALYYNARKGAKQDVMKMFEKLRNRLHSPYAMCFLIRTVAKLIQDGDDSKHLMDFLRTCTRHKSDMVGYEAAAAIVNLKNQPSDSLKAAVSVLQLFLASSKAVLRYAAVRTLNMVSIIHPDIVNPCNLDLENLCSDSNRLVATLANTTLLNTCNESSVDRLMRQISNFVSDISDELKIAVVQNIRTLCRRFPKKHGSLLSTLASFLREEGGLEYKSATVDTIIAIIEDNPEAKELGLVYLCEFIEDCEHTSLAVRILYLLGQEGPRVKDPRRYIRYIYNRTQLENFAVRAAAISTLARFGALCQDLLPDVLVLLDRCKMDPDDEVRDRATMFRFLLTQPLLKNLYILSKLEVSLPMLEKALLSYIEARDFERSFDIGTVPLAPAEQPPTIEPILAARPKQIQSDLPQESFKFLPNFPQFAAYGPLFKMSDPIILSDSDMERYVKLVKHVFNNHIVLEFICVNTMDNQILENVSVELGVSDEFEVDASISCPALEYNVEGRIYVSLAFPESVSNSVDSFPAKLLYLLKEDINGNPNCVVLDDYPINEVEIEVSDHCKKVEQWNFNELWEELGEGCEIAETFLLQEPTLKDAVWKVANHLGLKPCMDSDSVPSGKTTHTVMLSGLFRGGYNVLAIGRMGLSEEGIAIKLVLRSSSTEISELVASAMG